MKDLPHELILLNDLKLTLFSPVCITSCLHMCVLPQSCPTLCDPVDCSLPGFSIHGISQAKILELVAISFSRGSSWPRDRSWVFSLSCMGQWILYHWATLKAPITSFSSVTQSCPTFCDPMNCSTPGLPVHHQLLESN